MGSEMCIRDRLTDSADGGQPGSDGEQPLSDGGQPSSDGGQQEGVMVEAPVYSLDYDMLGR